MAPFYASSQHVHSPVLLLGRVQDEETRVFFRVGVGLVQVGNVVHVVQDSLWKGEKLLWFDTEATSVAHGECL